MSKNEGLVKTTGIMCGNGCDISANVRNDRLVRCEPWLFPQSFQQVIIAIHRSHLAEEILEGRAHFS